MVLREKGIDVDLETHRLDGRKVDLEICSGSCWAFLRELDKHRRVKFEERKKIGRDGLGPGLGRCGAAVVYALPPCGIECLELRTAQHRRFKVEDAYKRVEWLDIRQ
jgi:hypothetical protein